MAVDPDNSAPAKKKVLIGLGLLALIVVFVASCSSSWSRCGDYDRDIVYTYSPGRGDYDRRGSDYVYRPDGTGDYRREIRYIYNPNGGAYDLKNGEYVYVGCSKRTASLARRCRQQRQQLQPQRQLHPGRRPGLGQIVLPAPTPQPKEKPPCTHCSSTSSPAWPTA